MILWRALQWLGFISVCAIKTLPLFKTRLVCAVICDCICVYLKCFLIHCNWHWLSLYLIDIPKYYDAFWRKANMHLECLLPKHCLHGDTHPVRNTKGWCWVTIKRRAFYVSLSCKLPTTSVNVQWVKKYLKCRCIRNTISNKVASANNLHLEIFNLLLWLFNHLFIIIMDYIL